MKKFILLVGLFVFLTLGGIVSGAGVIPNYYLSGNFVVGTSDDNLKDISAIEEVFVPAEEGKQIIYGRTEGGSEKTFSYKTGDGETRTYEIETVGRGDPNYQKNPGGFAFEDGELVYAKFNSNSDQKVKLGDYEYEIPKGAKVEYEKKNDEDIASVKISLPDGTEVNAPSKIDGIDDPEKTEVWYDIKTNGGSFKLEGYEVKGYPKEGGALNVEVGYDIENENFFMDRVAQIGGLEIGLYEDTRTNLYFDKESIPEDSKLDKPYLFLNKKEKELRIFSPVDMESPTVRFLEGNDFGVDVSKKTLYDSKGNSFERAGFLSVQALGRGYENSIGGPSLTGYSRSLITINAGEDGKIPQIKTEGAYSILSGNRLVRYSPESEGLRFRDLKSLPYSNDLYGDENTAIKGEVDLTTAGHVAFRLDSLRGDKNKIVSNHNGKETEVDYSVFMDGLGVMRFGKSNEVTLYENAAFAYLDPKRQKDLQLLFSENSDVAKILSSDDVAKSVDQAIAKRALGAENVIKAVVGDNFNKDSFVTTKPSKSGVVALKFSATWCVPCQGMKRDISANKDKIGGTIYDIDTDRNPTVTKKYRITSLPTVVFVDKNGKEVGRQEGYFNDLNVFNSRFNN